MCDHLVNPGLLIEVRELQVLSLLSQLVLANMVGFARCHEERQNLSLKVSTIWHTSPLLKIPMKTSSTTRTLNFKSGCETLSTTEAKYIAMSQPLRDVIPVMNLLQEMRERDYQVICTEPHVYCKVFEDNFGALELARLPKLRPRTKHINVCYHHFREHVRKGLIKIFPIDTKDQIADALTKALAQNDFQRHRRFMCGK
jgi:hypothetical protein